MHSFCLLINGTQRIFLVRKPVFLSTSALNSGSRRVSLTTVETRLLELPTRLSRTLRDPDLILLDIGRNKGPQFVRFLVVQEYGTCLAIHDVVGVLNNEGKECLQIHLGGDDLTHWRSFT